MQTTNVREATILLPSADDEPTTIWEYPDSLNEEKITNTAFRGLDLSSHRWKDVTLSRVWFKNCRMMGLNLTSAEFKDVLIEGCQLDYSMFARLRTTGSVAFVDCKLTESVFRGSDLSGVVFSECTFDQVELHSTKMTGTDLRGNDISGLKGVWSLQEAEVSGAQLTTLMDSLVDDLNLKVSDL